MKYSKQRELILEYVNNSCEHPTADMVYNEIKKKIPNISLGTVYRNLNQLSENKLLRRIAMPGTKDRFDKCIIEHSHMYCQNCQEIIDIDKSIIEDINLLIESKTRNKVISNNLVLVGICHDCLKK